MFFLTSSEFVGTLLPESITNPSLHKPYTFMKNISELRQDPITGAWVVIATGRARRPHLFAQQKKQKVSSKKDCPFEELMKNARLVIDSGGEIHHLTEKNIKRLRRTWSLQVVPNKYPALKEGRICPIEKPAGPHRWMEGVGFHEVIITKDHFRPIAFLEQKEVEQVVKSYRERFHALKDEDCVEYISVFHNHGKEAGASITHPHSQLIATPVVPPDISRSLKGSQNYAHLHRGECIHCVLLTFELKEKKRIVYENKDMVVLCPYVSRTAFEIRIFPKRHSPRFEISYDDDLSTIADALRVALKKLYIGLHNPPHNFFIHTSPTSRTSEPDHYHWHIEIIPKTDIWAGFDISTGIEISSIAPEVAARFLKNIKA